MDYWIHIYRAELVQMHALAVKSLSDDLHQKVHIPFYVFCKLVYNQSSTKIPEYEFESHSSDSDNRYSF